MDGLASRVGDLEDTVYKGNGKPALVTRVAQVEDRVTNIESSQKRWEAIAIKLVMGASLSLAGSLLHLAWAAIAPHVH